MCTRVAASFIPLLGYRPLPLSLTFSKDHSFWTELVMLTKTVPESTIVLFVPYRANVSNLDNVLTLTGLNIMVFEYGIILCL